MAYNNAIPTPTDQLSVSQGQLLGNFAAIQTLVGIDHYTFNTGGAFEGKHKQTTFPVLGAGPTTLANEVALYSKNVSAVPHLFLRLALNGAEIDLSAATATANGTTTLPSGLILKWGLINQGSQSINAIKAFAFPAAYVNNNFLTLISTVNVGNPSGDALITLMTNTLAGGTVYLKRITAGLSNIDCQFNYFAIGN